MGDARLAARRHPPSAEPKWRGEFRRVALGLVRNEKRTGQSLQRGTASGVVGDPRDQLLDEWVRETS